MSRRPLIIQNAQLQTSRQRYAYAVLTLVFWVIWLYLWTPLITLVAWLFGAERFYDAMIVQGGIELVKSLIGIFSLLILGMGTVFGGWAVYNRWLVRGRDKRRGSPPVTDIELCEHFQITAEQLQILRSSRHAVVAHNDDGNISKLRAGTLLPPPITPNNKAEARD
ncbi:MAG: poly-beta-1,6-N-acetyl-D-glucosamine biosynthesis protein PgaD [Chromatiales bacterium]|jgi:biofilm PGA synthesis protein PgaD|nr:poly-beta-1,6-N-acetyl-D-glucosamine biosynthesis protein PgaD [Chromatiales bacterium]